MSLKINDTSSYHINEMETLGWELTVCNSLEPSESPCRAILKKNLTFGNLLYDYLTSLVPLKGVKKIIEVGGGYGYIMRDFLSKNKRLRSVMLDISEYLLNKQRETLQDRDVTFINKNFFDCDDSFLSGFDLALFNENIGDFPTIYDIDEKDLAQPSLEDSTLAAEVTRLINTYSLPLREGAVFNINLGALQAVEKVCSAGIPYIYMSEHSCEAEVPEPYRKYFKQEPVNNPERIRLRGHDEYTIRFSHLEKVAGFFSYKTVRGCFADFIEIDFNDRIHFILSSSTQKDEHEIIRLFIEDLFKYEFLVMIKN